MTRVWALAVLWMAQGGEVGLPAAGALRSLADREGLSLVTAGIRDDARYTGLMGETPATLRAIASECGLDIAVWRGILLARPDVGGTVTERIARALDDHDRALLLRPPDAGQVWEPGWNEYVVKAAGGMLLGDDSDEALAVRRDAILWMVAQDIQHVARWEEAIGSGRAFIRVVPNPGAPDGPPTTFNDSHELLLAKVLRTDPDDPMQCLESLYAGADYSLFVRIMEEMKPLVTEEEVERRYLAAVIEQYAVGLADTGATISLDTTRSVPELLALLEESGGRPLVCAAEGAPLVTVSLDGTRVEDAVLAVAAVCGLFASQGGEVDTSSATMERVLTCLPLRLWAEAMATGEERNVAEQSARKRFWAALPPEEYERLSTGWSRLETLTGEARAAAEDLLWRDPACRLAAAVWSLPRRDGPLPIALYHQPREFMPQYVVVVPSRAEELGSNVYLDLYNSQPDAKPLEWKVSEP